MKFITTAGGHVLGTHTFARGFCPAQRKDMRRLTEAEATCHAAWLEKHASWEEASQFIDDWANGKLVAMH